MDSRVRSVSSKRTGWPVLRWTIVASADGPAPVGNVPDPQGNQITAPQLAVDGQVEQGKLPGSVGDPELDADCPDFLELEGQLWPDQPPLVPGYPATGGRLGGVGAHGRLLPVVEEPPVCAPQAAVGRRGLGSRGEYEPPLKDGNRPRGDIGSVGIESGRILIRGWGPILPHAAGCGPIGAPSINVMSYLRKKGLSSRSTIRHTSCRNQRQHEQDGASPESSAHRAAYGRPAMSHRRTACRHRYLSDGHPPSSSNT